MRVYGVIVNSKDHSKSIISDYIASGSGLYMSITETLYYNAMMKR